MFHVERLEKFRMFYDKKHLWICGKLNQLTFDWSEGMGGVRVFAFIYFCFECYASSGVCFLTQNYFLAKLRYKSPIL